MKVSCSGCGKLFDAQRHNAKTCSVTCRKRASRNSAGTDASPVPLRDAAESPRITAAPHPLIAQTTRELEEAGVLESVLGQTALRLAEKLAGNFDTGSAMASLSREFRSVRAEALSSGSKKADSLDELALRRFQKASGA